MSVTFPPAKAPQAVDQPSPSAPPFWQTKTLEELSSTEWEQLCDGCGRCCLSKLEDIDTGAIAFTCVGSTLLDPETARCSDYPKRFAKVPDCLAITAEMARNSAWLPPTCAYSRVARGEGLDWWHPLVSGTPDTVIAARISVAGRVISEDHVDPADLEDHIENWPDEDPEVPASEYYQAASSA
ncbi:MAG: YcgN family cysteine cluster protein [Rhizobiales bacterium]|nr:YcgN family cysteine cluster protein [Hyphomicrobiales bacterium]